MKNLKRVSIAIVLFVLGMINVQAQDVITMKGGETMEVKITELTENIIKYHDFDDADKLIFTIPRGLVKEIDFGFGKQHVEVPPTKSNIHYFTGDKRQILKVNFTSIANNATILSYERAIKPEYSIEASAKIVGLGVEVGQGGAERSKGFAFDFGPKFKMKSILKKSGEYRPRHLLHGGYFKPTLGLNFIENGGDTKTFANFGIDLGKQWIIGNFISLDAFAGFHYLAGKTTSTNTYNGVDYLGSDYVYTYEDSRVNSGDLAGGNNIAVTFGVKIGILFDGKRK